MTNFEIEANRQADNTKRAIEFYQTQGSFRNAPIPMVAHPLEERGLLELPATLWMC